MAVEIAGKIMETRQGSAAFAKLAAVG